MAPAATFRRLGVGVTGLGTGAWSSLIMPDDTVFASLFVAPETARLSAAASGVGVLGA